MEDFKEYLKSYCSDSLMDLYHQLDRAEDEAHEKKKLVIKRVTELLEKRRILKNE